MPYTTHLFDGSADQHAILLPGGGYTVDMPLLWYATTALRYRHWTVHQVSWSGDGDDDVAAICRAEIDAIDPQGDRRVLIVGKSMGSLALPVVVERDLPGVWLTPLLTRQPIARAVQQLRGPGQLLVGGTADHVWDPQLAAESPAEVLEIPDADHALQIDGDLDATLGAIDRVTREIDRFVAAIA